jgi:L-lactate utilization protein LutB
MLLPRRSKLEEVLHRYHVVVENGVEAHVGRDRMRPAIFEKYYWWPDGATEDIQGYCKSCVECSKTTPCLLKPPLQAVIAKHRRARCQFVPDEIQERRRRRRRGYSTCYKLCSTTKVEAKHPQDTTSRRHSIRQTPSLLFTATRLESFPLV